MDIKTIAQYLLDELDHHSAANEFKKEGVLLLFKAIQDAVAAQQALASKTKTVEEQVDGHG